LISATLDTNVYIRAFQTGGPAMALLQQAKAGKLHIDVSEAIIDEVCGVLRDKFKWDGFRGIRSLVYRNSSALRLIPGTATNPIST
jgi:predicted nucleic acid-binding protein